MSRVLARPVARFAVMAILAAAGVLGLVTAQAAVADDTTVAWSVSPAGPDGVADGRTRLELKTDPGGSVQDRVVISNVSTVARTFSVYGADDHLFSLNARSARCRHRGISVADGVARVKCGQCHCRVPMRPSPTSRRLVTSRLGQYRRTCFATGKKPAFVRSPEVY
jgi:hypothetical protein